MCSCQMQCVCQCSPVRQNVLFCIVQRNSLHQRTAKKVESILICMEVSENSHHCPKKQTLPIKTSKTSPVSNSQPFGAA